MGKEASQVTVNIEKRAKVNYVVTVDNKSHTPLIWVTGILGTTAR